MTILPSEKQRFSLGRIPRMKLCAGSERESKAHYKEWRILRVIFNLHVL